MAGNGNKPVERITLVPRDGEKIYTTILAIWENENGQKSVTIDNRITLDDWIKAFKDLTTKRAWCNLYKNDEQALPGARAKQPGRPAARQPASTHAAFAFVEDEDA